MMRIERNNKKIEQQKTYFEKINMVDNFAI